METKGKVVDISKNLSTGKIRVTFEVDSDPVDELNELKDVELDIIAKKHKEKRSLDANSYFHVLVGKIADKQKISKPMVKNILIERYGQIETDDDGKMVILKTTVPVEKMRENEYLHCCPIKFSEEKGVAVTWYKIMRGSHTYNTNEMSILIDGTVQEAKDMGIETMPPNEIKWMLAKWQRR